MVENHKTQTAINQQRKMIERVLWLAVWAVFAAGAYVVYKNPGLLWQLVFRHIQ